MVGKSGVDRKRWEEYCRKDPLEASSIRVNLGRATHLLPDAMFSPGSFWEKASDCAEKNRLLPCHCLISLLRPLVILWGFWNHLHSDSVLSGQNTGTDWRVYFSIQCVECNNELCCITCIRCAELYLNGQNAVLMHLKLLLRCWKWDWLYGVLVFTKLRQTSFIPSSLPVFSLWYFASETLT